MNPAAAIDLLSASCSLLFALLFLEARDERTLGRFERAVAWTGVAVAGLALVPGLFFTDDFVRFDVAWLGATYRIPEPSPFGTVSLVYFLAAMATMTARVSRKWKDGWRWRTPIMGSLLVLGLAFHDSLAVARVITSPLLVDLGFLVAIVGSGVSELSRLVGDAQRLEQLSGGVAHEINNPTAVVLSNLRYVRGALQADGRVPDDAAEALDDASAATERIARIVRDLSDAGRVANRSLEFPHQVCEVDEVVERALGALPGLVSGAPRPQLHGMTHLRARIDDGVLEKALLSLLQNAATAVAKGLLHAQGGDLRFLGNTPQGTSFLVVVPRA